MEDARLDPGERLDLTADWEDVMHEAIYRVIKYGKVVLDTGYLQTTIDYTDR